MTREELKSATGQELIDQRNYCGVDGYYGDYLDNVNEEMLNRFNRLAELEAYNEKLLDGDIEKHNKIVMLEKENAKLKEKLGDKVMQDQKDKADLVWKLKTANEQKTSQLAYALTIIKDLLDNSDEYARQRAEDFLKESK